MIVTIDGPAGAGKSTVAKRLAERLGFQFLDTGAMYRAAALAAMQSWVDIRDEEEVGKLIEKIDLKISDSQVILNGQDVTGLLRSPEVSQNASVVAENPRVRAFLVDLQRSIAVQGNFVCEGRDQGTVVFPDAECKVFLTASARVRAERRWRELKRAGEDIDLDVVIAEQKIRDLRDETRKVGRLVKADDAVVIYVDNLSIDDVLDQLEILVSSRNLKN